MLNQTLSVHWDFDHSNCEFEIATRMPFVLHGFNAYSPSMVRGN